MRPCETCVGECCRHYYVGLSGRDVWTIASGLQLIPEQFVNIAQEQETTGFGFKLDATKTTFSMLLGKRPGEDGRSQCSFLMELGGGVSRCGIYGLRPSACRSFPAQLRDGAVVFRDDVICSKGAWSVDAGEEPGWRRQLLRAQMEWAIYAAVVRRWNDRAQTTPSGEMQTPAEYYGYLMDRYARLDALERELPREELDALVDGWGAQAPQGHAAPWKQFLSKAEAVIAAS